ncbi:MAG: ABC transporter permease [Turicibacter sp.]|nr:ABC transporter permease [Turicibacter sp.]
MRKFGLVFWFHFKESITGKKALISGLVLFVISLGFFGATHWFSQQEGEQYLMAVVQDSGAFVVDLNTLNSVSPDIGFEALGLEEARQSLESGEVDTVFVIEGEEIPTLKTLSERGSHSTAEFIVTQELSHQYLARVMEQEDISPELLQSLLSPVAVTHETFENMEEFFLNFAISWVVGMALYMVVATSGTMIGTSVMNEKASRVMEVMISKVRPTTIMYAKILSNLASVMVTSLMLYVGYLAASVLGWADMEQLAFFGGAVDFASVDPMIWVLAVAYFILGYLVYGMFFAMAGALCTKVEDYQSVAAPITISLMIPFFAMMWGLTDGIFGSIATYIPLFSPFITFSRFADGTAGYTEVGITLVLLLISILLIGKLATKIYTGGVMHYSEKASFKDIRKLLKG